MTTQFCRALVVVCLLVPAAPAFADDSAAADPGLFPTHSRVWDHFAFTSAPATTVSDPAQISFAAASATTVSAPAQTSPAPRVAAVEYSDAYKTRAKIHKYASFATLPLFATELWLGQSTFNDPYGGHRGAHIAVGTGIIGLFGVNTITGAWNLWEGRNDQNGRTRRLIHGLLMMGSDVGFLATWATGPNRYHYYADWEAARSTHRTIAITSIVTATTGYLIMALGGH